MNLVLIRSAKAPKIGVFSAGFQDYGVPVVWLL